MTSLNGTWLTGGLFTETWLASTDYLIDNCSWLTHYNQCFQSARMANMWPLQIPGSSNLAFARARSDNLVNTEV